MVDPILQSGSFQLAQKMLDASALRQEAIASNIANVDTPGYHRIDVAPEFSQQLKSAYEAGESPAANDLLKPRLTEDPTARAVRPDGNNVGIERELLAMNRNTVEYDFESEVVSQNIKQLRIAITGNPS
ncbi:MAG TPA: flagellar basal body rod protein FlgB [Opitutaceae bacterium]|nr:flagellar basal body rod protein FlgB [Opitutaceae bacterium]